MISVSKRSTVLISEPQLMEMGLPYLPIMWGILKTYWEHHGAAPKAVEWLPPIHQMGDVSALLLPYRDQPIDVLGLSCYTWNWALQRQIAQAVKARHPNCLIVAGGPEPDYKDPEFFRENPFIDMIAVKDGEMTFTSILDKVLSDDGAGRFRDDPDFFTDVPGLYLPGLNGGGHVHTGPAQVPAVFDRSPYIEQNDYYRELRESLPGSVVAVWETNRGCPYRCSFCDWGSNTMSKLRVFDMERVKAEIEWFGQMRIGFIMSADANFGILPRDLEITDLIASANRAHGFPNYFTYNTAKNNPDRTVAIARKLIASGLASAHVLSIQHTNADVLAATDRKNISVDKQVKVVKEMLEDGIPIYVQLILGIPGDTYRTWKQCFYDLMEWGVHTYYWVFPYNLLPNAPAADPGYVEKWEIETTERYVLLNHGGRPPGEIDEVAEAKSRLIVSTKSFSRDDWVRMHTHAACIKALHNCSVTQSIAIYMRFSQDVSYEQFYDDLIEDCLQRKAPTAGWLRSIAQHYRDYLDDADAVDFMEVPQLPSFTYHMDPSRWLFIQICMNVDAFFDLMTAHLLRRYPAVACMRSVIDYQKNLLILPDYESTRGKTFQTEHDWVAYFAEARRLITYAPLPDPMPTPGATVSASDTAWSDEESSLPLTWGGDFEERWSQWIHTTVIGRNSSKKNNLQELGIYTGRVGAAAEAV